MLFPISGDESKKYTLPTEETQVTKYKVAQLRKEAMWAQVVTLGIWVGDGNEWVSQGCDWVLGGLLDSLHFFLESCLCFLHVHRLTRAFLLCCPISKLISLVILLQCDHVPKETVFHDNLIHLSRYSFLFKDSWTIHFPSNKIIYTRRWNSSKWWDISM